MEGGRSRAYSMRPIRPHAAGPPPAHRLGGPPGATESGITGPPAEHSAGPLEIHTSPTMSTATQAAESHEFQAETRELLDLMIHSLYSEKEIFLRELISNSSDALDKLRAAKLTDDAFKGIADVEAKIELDPDSDARTLAVSDTGIGMDRDDLIANLGTIASSGTKRFLEELRTKGAKLEEAPNLIGQFGVGFYAAFMVADEVTVTTRKAGSDEAWTWRSTADGSYEIEPAMRETHGTTVRMKLKELDAEESGAKDYTEEWVLREVVKRYSDFVEYPVQMQVSREEVQRDEEGKEIEGAERETVIETVTLNSMKPLWTRPKAEITEEEHTEFYKHIARDWEAPLDVIHFRAEGTLEYTALLYLPKKKPMGLFDPNDQKSHVSLYVRRVFIKDDVEELLPVWLRFVRGLVDSSDLPLNVSRETLQHARQLGQINKRLVSKTIDAFSHLADSKREEYEEFWGEFGPVIKEGLYHDDANREAIAKVTLVRTTHGDGWSTLAEVAERAGGEGEAIHTHSAPDLATAKASPLLEAYAKKGKEVVFLTDGVDEFAFQKLTEFAGHPVRSIAKGEDEDLTSDDEKKELEESSKQHEDLLTAIQGCLSEQLEAVRFTGRLTESAAVLVSSEHAMAPHIERMMREAQGMGGVPEQKRTLELNPKHALVERMAGLRGSDDERFGKFCELLYGQALLAEGSPLGDPARFGKLVTELMID